MNPKKDETGRTAGAELNAGPESGDHPETPPFWRRRRTRVVFLCVGLFVLGAGVGSLVTSRIIRHRVRRGFRHPDRIASHVLSRIRDDLDLTAEQAEKILPVLKKHFHAVHDAIRREHEVMNEEIGQFLDERQLAEHRRLVAERRARFLGPRCGTKGKKQ